MTEAAQPMGEELGKRLRALAEELTNRGSDGISEQDYRTLIQAAEAVERLRDADLLLRAIVERAALVQSGPGVPPEIWMRDGRAFPFELTDDALTLSTEAREALRVALAKR